MDDIEAAERAPPRASPPTAPAPAQAPTLTLRRAVAAEMKAAVADAVIYCFLGAMFMGSAASIALVVARYAVGGGSSYAHAVVAFARDVFLRAFAAELLLCPSTILLLLLRLNGRQPEPPAELVLVRDSNPFPFSLNRRSNDSPQAFLSVGYTNFVGIDIPCSCADWGCVRHRAATWYRAPWSTRLASGRWLWPHTSADLHRPLDGYDGRPAAARALACEAALC